MSDSGFLKFIFNDDTKMTMLNIGQFAFIALIPLILLVKLLNVLPEANEKKGFLETLFEVILHVIILVIGTVIIVQFALYFKPVSGTPYPEFTLYPMILSVLLTSISFQTKISEKIFLLKEKIGNTQSKTQTQSQTPQSYSLTRQLQTPQIQTHSQTPQVSQKIQEQLPNYNLMYQNHPVTLEQTTEPFIAAANDFGSSFGSNF
jgi:general stress protein CsbA